MKSNSRSDGPTTDLDFLFPDSGSPNLIAFTPIEQKEKVKGSKSGNLIRRMKSWTSPLIPSPLSPPLSSSENKFAQRPNLLSRRTDYPLSKQEEFQFQQLPTLEIGLSRLSWSYSRDSPLTSLPFSTSPATAIPFEQELGLGFDLPPSNLHGLSTPSSSTSSLNSPPSTLLPPEPAFSRPDQNFYSNPSPPPPRSNSATSKRPSVFSFLRSRSSSLSSTPGPPTSSNANEFGALFEGRKRGSSTSSSGGIFSSAHSSRAGSTVSSSGGFNLNLGPPLRPSFSSGSTKSSLLPKGVISPLGNSTLSIETVNEMEMERKKMKKVKVGESAQEYVDRLRELFPGEVTRSIMTSGNDAFHIEALELHLLSYDFSAYPLDIALKKFLFQEILPDETQQIDSVMEVFSKRYHSQNQIFPSSDTSHILSFSLLLLNSDLWNGSNKVKMSREAYIKNTTVLGVEREILEYFYDQISASPFILAHALQESVTPTRRPSVSSFFGSKDKVLLDPYAVIENGTLKEFQLELETPLKSQFESSGTTPFLDITTHREAFARAPSLEIPGLASLKIVKFGLLSRKELEDGKKSKRSWTNWAVILTTSQLLFFKDSSMVNILTESSSIEGQLIVSSSTLFKPDAVLSLFNSAAIFDYSNVFRLISAERQYLFRVDSEVEMNDWISKINIASSYKTAGVKILANASTSRSEVLRAKMQVFEEESLAEKTALRSLLLQAQHLALLTPILKSTRDRLQLSLGQASKQILLLQINAARLTIYQNILSRDFSTENYGSLRRSRSSSSRAGARRELVSASMSRFATEPTAPEGGSENGIKNEEVELPVM